MRNGMGVEVKKGHWVMARDWNSNLVEGRVVQLKRGPNYPRAVLDTGVEVAVEEIMQTLGPMEVGRDGTVLKRYAPNDTPESIRKDIEKALKA
jgi:glutathione peroxidase-family protein